jgi:hypothetical protein
VRLVVLGDGAAAEGKRFAGGAEADVVKRPLL